MAQKVADVMWEMLAKAGVKRCYGIVGDALNPVIDALRRNGKIEFIHVRHEEYGVFAAVADAYLSGNPVVVCGTAGPGVTHLFNGLTNHSLRALVAGLIPGYSARQMTYDLRRLRRKDLIQRIPQSQRYQLTDEGRRIAVFFTKHISMFP